jgi:ferredoxin
MDHLLYYYILCFMCAYIYLPTQGPKKNESVTINGKKVNAIVGQKVSVVAAQSRVKITYSCNKGDCGTCEVSINGRLQKACQAVIPSGKCDIKTL